MNLQKIPDNWISDLFSKRIRGRRISPECPPPYVTGDGLVIIDRRSHHDRRKAPNLKLAGDPNE